MRIIQALLSIILFVTLPIVSQNIRVTVSNSASILRPDEPVVISWDKLKDRFSGVEPSKLRLIDDKGASIAYQIDDVDGNNTLDEFSFTCTIEPRDKRQFVLTGNADSLASPVGPQRTDAVNYKRVAGKSTPFTDDDGPGTLRSEGHYPFDGVGWESEKIGYRIYLDERNAVDIQTKRIPGLHWDFIGRTGVDYQQDAYWGMDPLHVGPSFGIGGIALSVNNIVFKPNDLTRRRTRILSRGAVRAVVLVEYFGWKAGEKRYDLSSTFIIYAGDRITEHRVKMMSQGDMPDVATGIVRNTNGKVEVDRKQGYLLSSGQQSRRADSLTMMLVFPATQAARYYQTDVDDAVTLKFTPNRSLTLFVNALWQGEPDWIRLQKNGARRERERTLARISNPLVVERQ